MQVFQIASGLVIPTKHRSVAFDLPFGGGSSSETRRSSVDGEETWEIMPSGAHEDPRFDQHGFRRDANKLEREDAFLADYAARVLQQEQRWARHVSSGPVEQHALDALPHTELKRLARLGIPASRRGHIWPKLVRSGDLRGTESASYFNTLLAAPAACPGDPGFAAERQIDLDLKRTFPGHKLLSGEPGMERLRKVLVAYARRAPNVGYVQGMGFIAALFLIFVEDPEDAFW